MAYFSPEFGIAEALPQYSGGLGILAGDHLKAASSLGVPMVGRWPAVPGGLLPPTAQRRRLARRALPGDGPSRHGPHPVDGTRITVDLAGQALIAQLWVAYVGG